MLPDCADDFLYKTLKMRQVLQNILYAVYFTRSPTFPFVSALLCEADEKAQTCDSLAITKASRADKETAQTIMIKGIT